MTWKLMPDDAISPEDRGRLSHFVQFSPRFTQGAQVREFEYQWSKWLGVKYSVFVNSGSSANLLLVQACKNLYKSGEWVVQSCTWATNPAPIIQLGMPLTLCDVNMSLGIDVECFKTIIQTSKPKYLFCTHVLGFPAINEEVIDLCRENGIIILEDTCEAIGSEYHGKKLGTHGLASTFSFYYGHHITTIEGGMICTNDESLYHHLLLLRSHGLLRELPEEQRKMYRRDYIDEQFTFLVPGFNVRNTDLHATLGLSQMRRLDNCVKQRNKNLMAFLVGLDDDLYYDDFEYSDVSLFAFPIIAKKHSAQSIHNALKPYNIESRPLIAGNLCNHPMMHPVNCRRFCINADYIHYHGLYVGNNEFINEGDVGALTSILNNVNSDS